MSLYFIFWKQTLYFYFYFKQTYILFFHNKKIKTKTIIFTVDLTLGVSHDDAIYVTDLNQNICCWQDNL